MSDTHPHFLLGGSTDWRAAATNQVVFTADCDALSLQALPGATRPLVDAAGSFGGFEAAIGVAVDCQDRIYVLDGQACRLKRFDRCSHQFATLPCIGGCGSGPRQLSQPHGLAISRRNDIYIADTGNCRVQVFSIRGLALRKIIGPLQVNSSSAGRTVEPVVPGVVAPDPGANCPPQTAFPAQTWRPWDVVVSRRLRFYVSDYANGLIHVFDAHGCWQTAYDGSGPTSPALVKPTRLTIDRQDRIYVIQEGQSYVVVLNPDGTLVGTIQQPQDLTGRFCPVAVGVDINGNLCISDCLTQKIYFYAPVGNGAWCGYRCCGSLCAFATSLIFDGAGNPIFTDGARRVCQLQPQAAYQTVGTYYSAALDSKTYRCPWHRVRVSGSVPPGTAVRVDTFTAESGKAIGEILQLPDNRWATGQTDTDTSTRDWDCLVRSAPGRFLWLRLTLTGDGAATPVVDKAKVYYPRASSLKFLPAVYRADSVSGDFLDRFLSIFDTLRGRTSDQIGALARYFDPRATPANPQNVGGTDFLGWLASWLGISLQSNWPVAKRRALVRLAHRLYALRGTRAGLRLHIELYAGVPARILELFRLRRWLFLNQSKLGDCSNVYADRILNRLQIGSNSRIGSFQLIDYGDPALDLFNAYANRFLVVVPRWPGAQASDQQALLQIIDAAKPAHTIGDLQWADPRFRIGLQSFIGIDSVIGQYPVGIIEHQNKLGYDTVLGDPGENQSGPAMEVGERSRIGCSTVLN